MNEPKTIAVDDLFCAGMVATRCRLLRTTQNGQRTVFTFDDSNGAATAASLDYINNAAVGVRDFVSAYREMKSVSYAARRTEVKQ